MLTPSPRQEFEWNQHGDGTGAGMNEICSVRIEGSACPTFQVDTGTLWDQVDEDMGTSWGQGLQGGQQLAYRQP